MHPQGYPFNNEEVCIRTGEPGPQRKTNICTHSVGLPLRNRPCKNLPAISAKSPQLNRAHAFQQRIASKTEGHVQAQSQMTGEHGQHPYYPTPCMKDPCLWNSRMENSQIPLPCEKSLFPKLQSIHHEDWSLVRTASNETTSLDPPPKSVDPGSKQG